MSDYINRTFRVPAATGGETLGAVILADIKWGNDRYAVVAYEDQPYPNVFLWHWNSVEKLIGSEVKENHE